MTDSSSVGNPNGAALPPNHPLGPASPIPPEEKEAEFAERTPDGPASPTPSDASAEDSGTASDDGATADSSPSRPDGEGADTSSDDGSPAPDRREDVLDPSAGAAGHPADSIRDEQNTHDAGTVPAAFNGTGTPEDPEQDRRPEDAAAEPDSWDSGDATD